MGTWDIKPWDNDGAADWYGEAFEDCGLVKRTIETLELDTEDNFEEIRAAIGVVLLLCRVYIWPVESYDDTLKKAISKLDEMLKVGEFEGEDDEFFLALLAEKEILSARFTKGETKLSDNAKGYWLRFV